MEVMADILGQKCVLIQHLSDKEINIRFFDPEMLEWSDKIRETLSNTIGIPKEWISIDYIPGLLHSIKLKRTNNNG